jgi:hypothetical protein
MQFDHLEGEIEILNVFFLKASIFENVFSSKSFNFAHTVNALNNVLYKHIAYILHYFCAIMHQKNISFSNFLVIFLSIGF